MLSFKNLNEADHAKKQSKKIDGELPFFIAIVTLLASSGLGPYTILQKIKDIRLLPTVRQESIKLIKRIDLLGIDPLTAMGQAKDKSSSKALGEFLSGYVSAIQSGGNVINYLKSKMLNSFERLESREKVSVEKLAGIVHAWLTMQIVVLAVFILVASIGSTPLTGYMSSPTESNSDPPYIILIIAPIMSGFFIYVAKDLMFSNIPELNSKKIIKFAVPPIVIGTVLILSGILSPFNANPYVLSISLVIASIWPTIQFRKTYQKNIDAETATPQILRDITEARKAGIGPEKCIAHACKRTGYGKFTPIANSIASKLEWGVPINNIYESIKSEVNNFQVLISFRILFEVIFSGGGNVNTLDTLSDTSEKIYNIEKNKRDMLRPYVMVGFIIIVITGFTTLLTIDSFSEINNEKKMGVDSSGTNSQTDAFIQYISMALIVEAWLAGLFVGKITRGVYSGGFIFSILFVGVTIVSVVIFQFHLINISHLLKAPASS